MTPPDAREGSTSQILDTVLDAVITVDSQMRIQLFNRAAGELFGFDPATMLGQPLDRLIPPASRALHAAKVARFAQVGSSARAMGATQMLTGLRSDGSEIPIEASISRVGQGDNVLMTALIRDARQRRVLERAREAYTTAEATHRAKAEFLSRISHELRTPLNAVLGLTYLLQESTKGRLTAEERRQIGLVLAAAERLRALIDNMLTLDPSSRGAPAPAPAATDAAASPAGHVIYIEDEPVNALLVQELLRRWPEVRVSVASTGQDGLAAARIDPADLILLDMHLPDLNGLQVLRQLRDHDATRHICVVALSAGGTQEEVAQALAAGAARYWTKPIDFGPFLAGLRELLPRGESKRA
jgi:PAS domain S-box-containing protein